MITEVIDVLISHPMETILIFGIFYLLVRMRDYHFRHVFYHQIKWDFYHPIAFFVKWKIVKKINTKKRQLFVYIIFQTILLAPLSLNLIFNPSSVFSFNIISGIIILVGTVLTVIVGIKLWKTPQQSKVKAIEK